MKSCILWKPGQDITIFYVTCQVSNCSCRNYLFVLRLHGCTSWSRYCSWIRSPRCYCHSGHTHYWWYLWLSSQGIAAYRAVPVQISSANKVRQEVHQLDWPLIRTRGNSTSANYVFYCLPFYLQRQFAAYCPLNSGGYPQRARPNISLEWAKCPE